MHNIFLNEVIFLSSFLFVFSGLQKYLNQQGFHIVGYGCTTCIGNSGELDESVASAISENGAYLLLIGKIKLLKVIWLLLKSELLD